MGLDLKLLPMTFHGGDDAYSQAVLPVNRCHALFDAIRALPALQVPPEFNTWLRYNPEDDEVDNPHYHSYGNTREDGYGDPLTYVLARDLLRFAEHEGVVQYGNKGVWCYLEYLRPGTKVALYWD